MSFSNVSLDAGAFCLVYSSGGKNYPLHNGVFQVRFTSTVKHNACLYLDGVKFTATKVVNAGTTTTIRLALPNDGRSHKVRVVDPGGLGTPAAQSSELDVSTPCEGVVYMQVLKIVENAATKEQLVDVVLSHTGKVSETFTVRLLLDGKTVGTQISLTPKVTTYRTVTIPADGKVHTLSGEVKIGSYFADDRVLWYPITGNTPPPVPPDPTANATQFAPGETVVIQSATTSSPLATDGSEWVLLEISRRGTNNWTPAGTEGGFVPPAEDGTWSSTIPTNATDHPVGSQWDVRARRFRDYQESEQVIHYFDMVAGTVPDPPKDPGTGTPQPTLTAPRITGPVNRDQRGGTWLTIYGTGTPGARVEFKTERVTAWGQTNYVPQPTTIGKDGKWSTRVYGKKQRTPHDWKVLGYRGRIYQNKLFSGWSNRLDVTWHHNYR
ncbi:hypothetical protein [Nonomuraea candida]|uniref:hypothetical protein n=1 Tax=Nonomuraea candida TaxID=359159 RepID=UPI0005BE234D|nr:hypothetical protein [Nonomuraea candida]